MCALAETTPSAVTRRPPTSSLEMPRVPVAPRTLEDNRMTRGRALIVAGLLAAGGGVTAATLPIRGMPRVKVEISPVVGPDDEISRARHFFRVGWSRFANDQGASGHMGDTDNDHVRAAEHVTLRIDELDGSGQVIATALRPVDDIIPGRDRGYFDVQVPGQAAAYHVAVNSFAFIEGEN